MPTRAETPAEPVAPDEDEDEREDETEVEDEVEGLGVTPDASGEPQVPEGFVLCPTCAGGGVIPEEFREDENTQRCAVCNGFGRVVTGSLVPENALAPCSVCAGSGYGVKMRQEPSWTPPAPPPAPGEPQPPYPGAASPPAAQWQPPPPTAAPYG